MSLTGFDPYKALGNEIVTTMVKDYYNCLARLKLKKWKSDHEKMDMLKAVLNYESFFKSDRFTLYTDFSGPKIIRIIKERIENEVKT